MNRQGHVAEDNEAQARATMSPARIAQLLETERYGRSLELKAKTASTNDDARAAALSGAVRGHVVLADGQSSGRGSHGRTWCSPSGTDLYFSIVDRPALTVSQLPPLTLAVGLGVAEVVAGALADPRHPPPPASPSVEVKWPNDVWVAGRKCAGILLEAMSTGSNLNSLVIGVGINVNRQTFPDGLDHPATSMALAAGRRFDREEVLAAALGRVERWITRLEQEGASPVVDAVTERLALRGQAVTCGAYAGELVGIATDGSLRLRTDHGEVRCVSGRVRPAR